MDKTTLSLLKTLFSFSDELGVKPPQTNDIREWWINALQEMDKEYIYILYEIFTNTNNYVLKTMREDLERRKFELDAEKEVEVLQK